LKNKRIVISGGPSSGKTSIIKELENEGNCCFHEISRELIKKAQAKGIEQPFLENPEQFSKDLLEARIKQFHDAEKLTVDVFYDRGVHDIVGYMHYGKQKIPKLFKEACTVSNYDKVFLLPPWGDIHVMDSERYETFEQAKEIYKCLYKAYSDEGYTIVEVPKGTVLERKNYILGNIG